MLWYGAYTYKNKYQFLSVFREIEITTNYILVSCYYLSLSSSFLLLYLDFEKNACDLIQKGFGCSAAYKQRLRRAVFACPFDNRGKSWQGRRERNEVGKKLFDGEKSPLRARAHLKLRLVCPSLIFTAFLSRQRDGSHGFAARKRGMRLQVSSRGRGEAWR